MIKIYQKKLLAQIADIPNWHNMRKQQLIDALTPIIRYV